MTAKRKQHFVPRFYLKAFQSKPRRIHLYNLKRALSVENVSLKNQCYKRDFYGSDGETEEYLASLERELAPVLHSTISAKSLPPYRSREHEYLLIFVALQLLRTVKSAESIRQLFGKMMKQLVPRDKGIEDANLDNLRTALEDLDPVHELLRLLLVMKDAISDLKAHLVLSPRRSFITSDNPIFRYNQYCEGIQSMGVVGGKQRGLQLFAPISPHLHLILYDGTTYRVSKGSDRRSRKSNATSSDIDSLNMLQLISANDNTYFSCWEQHQNICRLATTVNRLCNRDSIVVQEFVQDDAPNVSLLHQYEQIIDLALSLTFLNLKKHARQFPFADRPPGIRNQVPGHLMVGPNVKTTKWRKKSASAQPG